jgi:hypothetical protein
MRGHFPNTFKTLYNFVYQRRFVGKLRRLNFPDSDNSWEPASSCIGDTCQQMMKAAIDAYRGHSSASSSDSASVTKVRVRKFERGDFAVTAVGNDDAMTFAGDEHVVSAAQMRFSANAELRQHEQSIRGKRIAFFLHHYHNFASFLPDAEYRKQKLVAELQALQTQGIAGDRVMYIEGLTALTQPPTIQGIMKPYQLHGLSWLVALHEQGTFACE